MPRGLIRSQASICETMPAILNIAFDNTRRLRKRVYSFEYKNVRFKLIQNNPRKWADILMTIVPNTHDSSNEQIRNTAGEFLSALSWQNLSRVAVQFLGFDGIALNFHLRSAKCRWFVFPQTPFDGKITGYGIDQIPAVETEEQRIALTLFREAFSSNKVLLSFLFYWQILEIGGNEPIGWINKIFIRGKHSDLLTADIQQLSLGSKKLGEYLSDDCRHAIAHVRRRPGKTALKFDLAAENKRLAISTRVVEHFSRYYIANDLKLAGKMCLVHSKDPYFPVYVKR